MWTQQHTQTHSINPSETVISYLTTPTLKPVKHQGLRAVERLEAQLQSQLHNDMDHRDILEKLDASSVLNSPPRSSVRLSPLFSKYKSPHKTSSSSPSLIHSKSHHTLPHKHSTLAHSSALANGNNWKYFNELLSYSMQVLESDHLFDHDVHDRIKDQVYQNNHSHSSTFTPQQRKQQQKSQQPFTLQPSNSSPSLAHPSPPSHSISASFSSPLTASFSSLTIAAAAPHGDEHDPFIQSYWSRLKSEREIFTSKYQSLMKHKSVEQFILHSLHCLHSQVLLDYFIPQLHILKGCMKEIGSEIQHDSKERSERFRLFLEHHYFIFDILLKYLNLHTKQIPSLDEIEELEEEANQTQQQTDTQDSYSTLLAMPPSTSSPSFSPLLPSSCPDEDIWYKFKRWQNKAVEQRQYEMKIEQVHYEALELIKQIYQIKLDELLKLNDISTTVNLNTSSINVDASSTSSLANFNTSISNTSSTVGTSNNTNTNSNNSRIATLQQQLQHNKLFLEPAYASKYMIYHQQILEVDQVKLIDATAAEQYKIKMNLELVLQMERDKAAKKEYGDSKESSEKDPTSSHPPHLSTLHPSIALSTIASTHSLLTISSAMPTATTANNIPEVLRPLATARLHSLLSLENLLSQQLNVILTSSQQQQQTQHVNRILHKQISDLQSRSQQQQKMHHEKIVEYEEKVKDEQMKIVKNEEEINQLKANHLKQNVQIHQLHETIEDLTYTVKQLQFTYRDFTLFHRLNHDMGVQCELLQPLSPSVLIDGQTANSSTNSTIPSNVHTPNVDSGTNTPRNIYPAADSLNTTQSRKPSTFINATSVLNMNVSVNPPSRRQSGTLAAITSSLLAPATPVRRSPSPASSANLNVTHFTTSQTNNSSTNNSLSHLRRANSVFVSSSALSSILTSDNVEVSSNNNKIKRHTSNDVNNIINAQHPSIEEEAE